jgi:ATP-dependent HslUV protease, peptidase subunit HslV
MSTIVVVRKSGKACIAADSLTTWGNTLQSSAYLAGNSKIIRVGETFIGIAGSAVHKLVLETYFSRLERPCSLRSRQEIFEVWTEMHRHLKEDFYLNPHDEKSDAYETSQMSVLLANPDGIFGVYSLRSVDEFTKFWAFGSGTDYALGALYSCYDRLKDAEEIARKAVEAAAEFDDGTALPAVTHTVKLRRRQHQP